MNLLPTMGKILLEPILAPEKSKGGVWQPTSARKVGMAKVLAIGPPWWDKKRETLVPIADVAVGDTVIYRTWDKEELCPSFVNQGQKVLVAEPADIYAKVTD